MVQAELCLLALLVALGPALIAVLLVSLALISLDGHSGVATLALSAAAALGMVVVGCAACTGILFLGRALGRGSRPAWAATLAGAIVLAVLSAWTTAALIAPALTLPARVPALLATSPSALGALLLVLPTTLRSVSGAPPRGSARRISGETRPAAQA
ncbi:MAG TPA: hypothetical protein VF112_02530 [Candidatus Dormibacteraeota bacterium]